MLIQSKCTKLNTPNRLTSSLPGITFKRRTKICLRKIASLPTFCFPDFHGFVINQFSSPKGSELVRISSFSQFVGHCHWAQVLKIWARGLKYSQQHFTEGNEHVSKHLPKISYKTENVFPTLTSDRRLLNREKIFPLRSYSGVPLLESVAIVSKTPDSSNQAGLLLTFIRQPREYRLRQCRMEVQAVLSDGKRLELYI